MNSLFFKETTIKLNDFYNSNTLNIFSDASIMGKHPNFTGCYGAIAVCKDDIIDSTYRIASHTTNNESEIKGIRTAISLAYKYSKKYKFINIFSDSQISVFGLRDYIYNWNYHDGVLTGYGNKEIKNQSIFIESHYLIKELILNNDVIVKIYHQSGHVGNDFNSIKEAAWIFRKSNKIVGNIDLNFIRYISTYNNYIDHTSRSYLRRCNHNITYCDPIYFVPKDKINIF